jgi:ribosome biogenesis GTPase
MGISEYGFEKYCAKISVNAVPEGQEFARVISESKDRWRVATERGEMDAEISGALRYSFKDRSDFPVVGDWVSVAVHGDDLAIIHAVLPRYAILSRRAAGSSVDLQVMAANVDLAILVLAAGRDFNLNRMERYLTLCETAGVPPMAVISKSDLLDSAGIDSIRLAMKARTDGLEPVFLSNITLEGFDQIRAALAPGTTACLLGSSGAGKSSLINNLAGGSLMKTGDMSSSTNKGRHTTSHRQLILLESGGIIIDNPGIREVGMGVAADSMPDATAAGEPGIAFGKIRSLGMQCRFRDCSHTTEKGCAVRAALERGELDQSEYDNFITLEKEKDFFALSAAEKRQRYRSFGKMMKNYHDDRKAGKFGDS